MYWNQRKVSETTSDALTDSSALLSYAVSRQQESKLSALIDMLYDRRMG
jgi:hypothetical protein